MARCYKVKKQMTKQVKMTKKNHIKTVMYYLKEKRMSAKLIL